MQLTHLRLQHFRNYDCLDMSFTDGLIILTGDNAQGKTNLLEAIFLLSLGKSHRTNMDPELIQWDHTRAMIQGNVRSRKGETTLELVLQRRGKMARINNLEQSRLSHFIGKLNVVLFAPEDLQLVKGSPSLRRKFIDAELAQSHPIYLQSLLDYHRVLKQRNNYLKQFGQSSRFDAVYFDVLTEQLVDLAVKVIQDRYQFITRLNELVQPIHHHLSNQKDQLTIAYEPSVKQLDYQQPQAIQEKLLKLFADNRSREQQQGVTLYGPHRDDLTILLNDRPAQHFGSQGQQRTIVLSIKLAEIEFIYEQMGEYPLLLLDDVLSELDAERQQLLMEHIEGKVQTFLTSATIEHIHLDALTNVSVIEINQGTATLVEKGED